PRKQLAASLRAMQIARALHDDALLVPALQWHAEAVWALGEDALQALRDLAPLAERVGDLAILTFALTHIGMIYLYDHADLARAKEYLEQALAAAERRGGPYLVVQTLTCWVEYHYVAGVWGLSRECAERAESIMRQLDRPIWYGLPLARGML